MALNHDEQDLSGEYILEHPRPEKKSFIKGVYRLSKGRGHATPMQYIGSEMGIMAPEFHAMFED